jgi:glutathione S-transferase
MKLYHHPVSTCSQKVRLVLAEKGLDFDSQIIDLQKGEQFDPEYMKLNPSAVVPTIDDGGRVYVESTLINEYLDDAYPDVPLKPADAGERHRMRHWCKQIDALHPSCGIQTYAIGIRPGLLQRPKEEVDALIEKIPDAPRRAMRRSVVDDGVRAPVFRDAYLAHDQFFAALEARLTSDDWLAGDVFSLADAALLPYVLRVDHLALDGLFEGRSGLNAWYQRVQDRPAYEVAVSAWLPDAVVANFRAAGGAVADDVREVLAAP